MQRRRIANTGLEVSLIGLGTVKFGRNSGLKYPAAFSLPSDHEIANLLSLAKELGINFLDTAPAYGVSEERLGKCLLKSRNDWVISTKAGEEFVDGKSHFDFSKKALCHSVERSLKRLHTDYLDIVLIHSNGDDIRLIEEENVFATLSTLKEVGKIRAFGMSTKSLAGGLRTIDAADVAMVTYNPTYTDERKVIEHANNQKKAIFIKKAFASGHLNTLGSDPIHQAIQFILAEPGVTSIMVGTINPEHLKENVEAIQPVNLLFL